MSEPLVLLVYVIFLAFLFAKVEIHVEGEHGWAAGLPTWRIENHPLLEFFWGGRPLTGYHVWAFSFMSCAFHLPIAVSGAFSLSLEARCLGCLMLFWVIEDFLWFAFSPTYTIHQLFRKEVPWHKYNLLGLPRDYWMFGIAGTACFIFSYVK